MAQKGFLSLNVKSHQPVRPAPPPPVAVKLAHAQNLGSSSRSSPMGQGHDGSKKKNAPPRPPPPKPSAQLKAVHNAVVFTEMLQKSHSVSQMTSTPSCGPSQDLLINWDAPLSPSTSPTPGRYSSDGLSLRSFGSDSSGIMANGGGSLSHGNSRSESGFESEPDAWSETIASNAPPPVVAAAEGIKPFVMPTIIRPNRPTKPVTSSSSSTHLQALEKKINSNCDLLFDLIDIQFPSIDNSPPEPTIPPPAPPSFFLDEPISSRNTVIDQRSQPCAEALYDYNSSHPGDLNFKEGDRILLESRINDEWLRGSVGSTQGIFPVSFVHILVPLEESEEVIEEEKPLDPHPAATRQSSQGSSYRAVAIYPFEAETSQDLSLQEGDEVDVSESLGNGWLYGRLCLSGRYGQFPEAFVRAV